MVGRGDGPVAGMGDQDRTCHQLEGFPPGSVAEAALSDVREGEAAMQLDERLVARPDRAPVVEHRDRSALQYRDRHRLPVYLRRCPLATQKTDPPKPPTITAPAGGITAPCAGRAFPAFLQPPPPS